MGKSRKKPITGVTCAGERLGEKKDKRRANRRLRRMVRAGDYDAVLRDVSDVWDFRKDGKVDWTGTEYEEKARRK